jgi:hypothetical protein
VFVSVLEVFKDFLKKAVFRGHVISFQRGSANGAGKADENPGFSGKKPVSGVGEICLDIFEQQY